MKYSTPLLLLSSVLPAALADTDAQVVTSYEKQGICAYYWEEPGSKAPLSQTCINYCANNGGHGYSECDRSSYSQLDLPNGVDPSTISKDDSGKQYVPCPCKCENPDVEGISQELTNIIIDGLSELDSVICAVMVTALRDTVEIGLDMIPVGAELTAVERAVEGAKSFAENGLSIADSTGSWISDACGLNDPDWPNSVWDILGAAPPKFGKSIGCKRKNTADCKPQTKRAVPFGF